MVCDESEGDEARPAAADIIEGVAENRRKNGPSQAAIALKPQQELEDGLGRSAGVLDLLGTAKLQQ